MKKIFLLLILFCNVSFAQKNNLFLKTITPADSLNKKREWLVHTTCAGTFSITMIWLNEAWYKGYPRSSFHFFNDDKEWLQMDKVGHAWSAYNEAYTASMLYQWAGMSQRKAAFYGAFWGFTLQLTIEILDGLSAEWGFSPGDATANTIGSSLFLGNELLWRDQRVKLKFSTMKRNYLTSYNNDFSLNQRANELYGTSIPSRFLKDYNAQSYWLSFNISSFLKKENKFPKWLNIAIGYGADNMFGAVNNRWGYDINGKPLDDAYYNNAVVKYQRDDLTRYRQFFISPDIDFTKIKTHSRLLRNLFYALNVLKLPAPTLEYNTLHQTKFHWWML
jgi:Predicted periplasmic lipoprotein (DUF2279)